MIPKIIHYCWFGKKEMPDDIKKYIESWKRKLPDYEIKLWNEDNFNINESIFTKQAYELKKYAFISDYVRLYALKKFGGVYLDTDIEIVKDITPLLTNKLVLGFDDGNSIISCFIASEPDHPAVTNILDLYDSMSFINKDGSLNMIPNTIWIQNLLRKEYNIELNGKYQLLNKGIVVYPEDYLHAKSLITGKLNITENTYTIHHHTLLWVSKKTLIIKFIRQNILIPILGKKAYLKFISKSEKNKILDN